MINRVEKDETLYYKLNVEFRLHSYIATIK